MQLINQLNLKEILVEVGNESKNQGDYYKFQCVKLSQRVREPHNSIMTRKPRSKSRASGQF